MQPTMKNQFSSQIGKAYKWLLIILIVIVAVIAVAYLRYQQASRRDALLVKAKLDNLKKKNIPISLKQLQQLYQSTAIPGKQNAAPILQNAFKLYQAPSVSLLNLSKNIKPLSEEVRGYLVAYIKKSKGVLSLIKQASLCGYCRFDINFLLGFKTPLGHLAKMRKLIRLLNFVTILAMENHDPKKAIEATTKAIELTHFFVHEPTLIAQMFRVAMIRKIAKVWKQCITQHELTDAQLQKLTHLFQTTRIKNSLKIGYYGELCMMVDIFQKLSGNSSYQTFRETVKGPSILYFGILLFNPFQNDFLFYLDQR